MENKKIIVFGTGSFAARIVYDIAATAQAPVHVIIAGRNVERLDWLTTAANARASIFGCNATFATLMIDMAQEDAIVDTIGELQPTVVVQAASPQASAVIGSSGNAWTQLISEAGLSATAIIQAMFPIRVSRAINKSGVSCHFINCSYPDVVNSMIAALGLPITCGIGNVAILSSVFAKPLGVPEHERMHVLAHYQTITPYRSPASSRDGPEPRIWVDGEEIANVRHATRDVKLTSEPVIDVSGASGVPLILAMAHAGDWLGHVPGPHGLPGGYPVRFSGNKLRLNLPASLTHDEAVSWNKSFEEKNGIYVDESSRVLYAGVLRDQLATHSPELSAGFDVKAIDQKFMVAEALRARLIETPEAT
jgi:hypothetical protein